MKDVASIFRRAVILVLFSDRCAMESPVIEGRNYSLEERERQRAFILSWLLDKGYGPYVTDEEMSLFELEAGKGETATIYSKEFQYEAIEPMLWALGLVKKLTSYEKYVLTDFHPVLRMNMNHSSDEFITRLGSIDVAKVRDRTEVAMLWNWRVRSGHSPIFREENAKDLILRIFGDDYRGIVRKITFTKTDPSDFEVYSKPFYELAEQQLCPLRERALWRHHAFEWMMSDAPWDEVDVST